MQSSIQTSESSFRWGWVSASIASVLLSVFVILGINSLKWYIMLAGALLFFGAPIVILAGDVVKRLVYTVFLIQFTVSLFLPVSFYMISACMIFLPPVLLLSKNINKIDAVPCRKSMLLLLSGWLVALVYGNIFHAGYKYFFLYDIYLLLGFGIAYSVFFLLKMEILDTDRLMRYIMISGMLLIAAVMAKYVVKGNVSRMFSGRFGMSVNVNSNLLSLYLNMTFPCAFLIALLKKQNIVKKTALYAIAAIQAGIIMTTGSRGALFGLGAVVVYFLWHKRSILWTIGSFAGLALVIITVGRKYLVRLLVPSTTELISDIGRLELLKAAYRVLRENYFFFGIGMNSFSLLKMEYGFPVWFPSPFPAEALSSHNAHAEIWLGWGFLGLIGWLAFNIGIIYALLRYNGEKYNGAAKAVALALISFLLYGLVDSNIGNFSLMFVYFSLAGIAMYVITQTKSDNV